MYRFDTIMLLRAGVYTYTCMEISGKSGIFFCSCTISGGDTWRREYPQMPLVTTVLVKFHDMLTCYDETGI